MASTNLQNVSAGQQSQTPMIFQRLDDPRFSKAVAAVAGKYFTADRFLRLAVNSIKKTPLLAQCDPQSVLGAFMASAALGLEPNTVQQQAFLIPYKKRRQINGQWVDTYDCQFQIGYRGFITLAHRSEHIDSIHAEAIHEGDLFDHMMGSQTFLKYRKSLKDRGELIGAFCHTILSGGSEIATVLPLDEIWKIRSKSETFNALERAVDDASNEKDRKKAKKNFDETPWVMWLDDMAAKSAIKKLAKQLPLTSADPMTAAAQIDDQGENNAIDLSAMVDPDVVRTVIDDGAPLPALEEKTPDYLEPVQTATAETTYVDTQARQTTKTTQATHGNDGGPTVEDALANVKRGDFDMARDIAHSLGKEAIAEVEMAISAAQPKETQAKPQGRRGFGNVE